jgi:hypothetical protein
MTFAPIKVPGTSEAGSVSVLERRGLLDEGITLDRNQKVKYK